MREADRVGRKKGRKEERKEIGKREAKKKKSHPLFDTSKVFFRSQIEDW